MLLDFLNSVNWVDVAIVALVARIIYIGIKTGFVIEFFKLLGVFFSCIIGLHYYSSIAAFFYDKVSLSETTLEYTSFIVLWSLITFFFKVLRDALLMIFKIDAIPAVNQWGGGVFAVFRAVLISGLVLFTLHLTNIPYITQQFGRSISRAYLSGIAPGFYTIVHDGLIRKFSPESKINEKVFGSVEDPAAEPEKNLKRK